MQVRVHLVDSRVCSRFAPLPILLGLSTHICTNTNALENIGVNGAGWGGGFCMYVGVGTPMAGICIEKFALNGCEGESEHHE